MSKYTITIKNLIENNFDFGLDSYPIFDEEYRETLNTKILNHYYMNEIGQETPALFKFMLNQKMMEIMPKYNILYQKQLSLLENLTGNVELTEELSRDTSSTTESSSNSTNKGKSLFQDTPQGRIWADDIENVEFATNVNMNRNTIDDESNATGTGTETYIKTIVGNNGNKYNFEVLNNLSQQIINIDMLVIDDLSELFMGLF